MEDAPVPTPAPAVEPAPPEPPPPAPFRVEAVVERLKVLGRNLAIAACELRAVEPPAAARLAPDGAGADGAAPIAPGAQVDIIFQGEAAAARASLRPAAREDDALDAELAAALAADADADGAARPRAAAPARVIKCACVRREFAPNRRGVAVLHATALLATAIEAPDPAEPDDDDDGAAHHPSARALRRARCESGERSAIFARWLVDVFFSDKAGADAGARARSRGVVDVAGGKGELSDEVRGNGDGAGARSRAGGERERESERAPPRVT